MMNLKLLEIALKKRWKEPYIWGRKQNNSFDQSTNFIYNIRSFSELLQKLEGYEKDMRNYALNRWYNFWSAQAVEYIFSQHSSVKQQQNPYDKKIDFSIHGLNFDHKTTVFPQGFSQTYSYAKQHKKELIQWLYENQSQQGRKHLSNRLFICLYDTRKAEHWKMKAEISQLKDTIDHYMNTFDQRHLIELDFGEGKVYSDIIWHENAT